MANPEESSPLLPKQQQQQSTLEPNQDNDGNKPSVDGNLPFNTGKQFSAPIPTGWTADGLPLAHGSVMGEPIMGRSQWNSSLCACLGQNDDFCSSDLEVCESSYFFLGVICVWIKKILFLLITLFESPIIYHNCYAYVVKEII